MVSTPLISDLLMCLFNDLRALFSLVLLASRQIHTTSLTSAALELTASSLQMGSRKISSIEHWHLLVCNLAHLYELSS